MSKQAVKIGVVGLGYVGLPLALALGRAFEGVVGFDQNAAKVRALTSGDDPTGEGFEQEIRNSHNVFSADASELSECNVIIVAVPTPIDENRQPDLEPLISASRTVGRVIKRGATVVFESTVYPGVTEEVCGPVIEEASGLRRGKDFFLGYSPERINPGDKQHTLERIVKVIAGENSEVTDVLERVYGAVVKAGLFRAASIRVAEAAKVIENTQRDLNIALMNELSIIFDRMGIRTRDVLDASETKWNFLRFTPGLVGGHCIGVDPYYLTAKAQQLGYHPQVILAGRRINDDMGRFIAQRTVKMMINAGIQLRGARVGILGVTFKENVRDTRNSRVPDIAYELTEFGIEPLLYDPVADPEVVHEEYKLELHPLSKLKNLQAVVVAVAHEEIQKMGAAGVSELLVPGGVIADIKSMFSPGEMPKHVTYWSL